jgi:alanyl-tRNA synthetase
VGDQGLIEGPDGEFQVNDTQKQAGDVFVHLGEIRSGSLSVGDQVDARVNHQRRQATVLNHSATHLLHAALRNLLGEHVTQKGSLVDPDRLRFDFSHFEPLTREQLQTLEDMVNEQIRTNAEVETALMSYDDAVQAGAMALFGEKYGDTVRVLKMGDFSTELCGGTHAKRAGDIGLFKIISESGIASGVRRIEAVTGARALQWVDENEKRLQRVAQMVKAGREDIEDKVAQMVQRIRALEKETEQLKGKLASNQGSDLVSQAREVNGIKVLAAHLEGLDAKGLRETVDQLKNKLGSAAVVLAAVSGGKVSLVAGVTSDLTSQIRAGDLVNQVATQVGGKGGGRPDMAQAGGNNPAALDKALSTVPDWIRTQVS